MECKAWNRGSDQMEGEYRMRKGLKIEFQDLNLKKEEMSQRKQWGNPSCTLEDQNF